MCGVAKRVRGALIAQRRVLEASQRALLGRVEAMTSGNLQDVVSLEGGLFKVGPVGLSLHFIDCYT